MHKQKGMTLIGWIIVVTIILVFALATMRLGPVYLQYFRIAQVMTDIPSTMETESKVSPTAIRRYIAKRFNIEAVTVIEPADIKIDRRGDDYVVIAAYEHKVPFMGNVSFAVDFYKDVKVAR